MNSKNSNEINSQNPLDFKSLSDEKLVKLFNQAQAQETLINRYKNLVRAKSRTYFLVGADTDDIIQEGMIGLYKAIRDFDEDKLASFKSFAELCITRQIITAIKTATRNKHFPLNSYISLNKPMYEDESEKTLMDVLCEESVCDPEQLILVKEAVKQIENQISKELSLFEKNVLEQYLQGCSYNEISQNLSKQTKSIDNALQRIKKKLSKTLTQN